MDAFFARNRLSAYLDGSLDESEAAEVEAALSRDAALRAEYEAMKRAVLLLRERGPVSAPPDLHAKIMRRVAQEPAPSGSLVWLRRPLNRLPLEGLALAAAALLVVIAIQWRPERPAEAPPPEAEPLAKVAEPSPAAPPELTSPSAPALGAPESEAAPKKSLALGKTLPVAPSAKTGASVAAAPEEPYVADWEKQETKAGPEQQKAEEQPGLEDALSKGVSMRTAYYYRLTTEDPAALEALASLAERSGGRLVDGWGEAKAPGALTADNNYTTVSIVIPPGRLGEVTGALRGLGAVANPPPASGALYAADQVVVVLEVLYRP